MFRPFGRSDRFYYVNFYFKEDFILMAETKKKGRLFDLPETKGAFQQHLRKLKLRAASL